MKDGEVRNPAAEPLRKSVDQTATHIPVGSESTKEFPQTSADLSVSEDLPDVPGFLISAEIARGGMGVVYAAHDPVFDRDVAVKVMHPGQDADRFVVESKVTGRLTHPGIPPVHALGELPDGRPFLAMKLIRGRTLADDLRETDPLSELPRLLGVFEQICQTVGFAHSAGIIHRDLKPANVMVGSFGEVQVMDWGMAKLVREPAVQGDQPAEHDPTTSSTSADAGDTTERPTVTNAQQDTRTDAKTVLRAAEPDDAGLHAMLTHLGTVMGTPSYMAPEQARAEAVDARTDVFALGGILTTILTGKPPFQGDTVIDTVKQAAAADVSDTFDRLDACVTDAELVVIAKRCLAADPSDRFDNGEQVAAAVSTYRANVEERLRQAERDRAVSAAEAREQRKRRRVQLALAGSVLLIVVGGGAFAFWQETQSADRQATEARLEGERDTEQRFKVEQAKQGVHANLALATDLRKQYKFREAGTALQQAAKLAGGGEQQLRTDVKKAQSDLAFVMRLDDIRYRKWVYIWEPGGKSHPNTLIASPEYHKALTDHGLNLKTMDLEEAAKQIKASAVKAELVAAVDDWALYEPDERVRKRLLGIVRRADPHPWRDRLRDHAVWHDKDALAKLASDVDPASTSPESLSMVANRMWALDLNVSSLFSKARAQYPSDFNLAFAFGFWLEMNRNRDRRIGSFEAARALRPDNAAVWGNLGINLFSHEDYSGAITALRKAIRLDPSFAPHHYNLASALLQQRDLEGAITAFKYGIKFDPTLADLHNGLGAAVERKGDLPGAIPHYREAIRLNPKYVLAHDNLGAALFAQGNMNGAETSFRAAIKLDPKYAQAHYNLGNVLSHYKDADGALKEYREAIQLKPEYEEAYFNLGNELVRKRDLNSATKAYREAIRINPKNLKAHGALASALINNGDAAGAITVSREAIKLVPKSAEDRVAQGKVHYNLGIALKAKGDLAGAMTAYKEAIRLNPKHAQAHINIGNILGPKGDVAGSIAAYREAIKHNPKIATARFNLGIALSVRGDIDAAIIQFKMGVKLDPTYPKAHGFLTAAYLRKGNTAAAIEALREGIKFNPPYQVHYTIAILYYREKKLPEAITSLRAAIKANPKFDMAHAMLGDLLMGTGDIPGARIALTEAVRLNPKWKVLLKKLPPVNIKRLPVKAKRPRTRP